MDLDSNWVSILDYAKIKGISISTIRRHIKAGRIKHQQIKGKYFLQLPASLRGKVPTPVIDNSDSSTNIGSEMAAKNSELVKENRRLRQEVADLKMLVQILESNQHEIVINESQQTPPELPAVLS